MIYAVIIDDEPFTCQALQDAVEIYCPLVKINGIAPSVAEGVKLINELQPQLVFLDIEMPEEDGFTLFSYFDDIFFDIIFVTSHDKFAVKAFKFSAVDYLLKPINPGDLQQAVGKVIKRKVQQDKQRQLELLVQQMNSKIAERIAVPGPDGVEFISLDQIIYLQANINYTIFYKKDGKKLITAKTLKEYEEILPQEKFFRIHKSYIVNIEKIVEYQKSTGNILLENQMALPIARRRKEEFSALILKNK